MAAAGGLPDMVELPPGQPDLAEAHGQQSHHDGGARADRWRLVRQRGPRDADADRGARRAHVPAPAVDGGCSARVATLGANMLDGGEPTLQRSGQPRRSDDLLAARRVPQGEQRRVGPAGSRGRSRRGRWCLRADRLVAWPARQAVDVGQRQRCATTSSLTVTPSSHNGSSGSLLWWTSCCESLT